MPPSPKTKQPPPKPKATPSKPASIQSTTTTVPPHASTATLPLYTEPQTAQSARTYLQKEGLIRSAKAKVKTRAEDSARPPEKRSIFGRWAKKHDEPEEKVPEPSPGNKHSFFSKLTKRTKTYMHQLLNTADDDKQGIASMKWDNFVKVSIFNIRALLKLIAEYRSWSRWASLTILAQLVLACVSIHPTVAIL